MKSEDWANVAKCANARVMSRTFSFDDEDNTIIGDLETREMAKYQAYRTRIVDNLCFEFVAELSAVFGKVELLTQLGEKTVTGLQIDILTD